MDLPGETVHHGSHRMNSTQKKQQMIPRAPICLYTRPQRRTCSHGVTGYCGVSKNHL